MTTKVQKDPGAELYYGFNWAASDGVTNDGSAADDGYLQGDTVSTSVWAVSGPDAALQVASDDKSTIQTKVKLTGGTEGLTYRVTNTITTSTTGEQDDRTIFVEIVQK